MPPRIPLPSQISPFNLTSLLRTLPSSTSTSACPTCLFSTTPIHPMKRGGRKKVRRRIDPYRVAQAEQRKTANLERQRVLQSERKAALGDPIRSRPTPFLASLQNPSMPSTTTNTGRRYLNYFLDPTASSAQIEHSKWLTEPLPDSEPSQHDEKKFKDLQALHAAQHANAEQALDSITALDNGSSKDRTRVNIQRCIEEFGRHNTDNILPPKPQSLGQSPSASHAAPLETTHPDISPEQEAHNAALAELAAIPKRVGPDTGSSEVQIAILTTKINTLADNLGKKDKNNKRNLRLLVHRRQKLLNYLRRRERGGPRWQNLVEKLGVRDAMWRGEISL